MLIDSRMNTADDFEDAVALTATGTTEEAVDVKRDELADLFLAKHAYMADFVKAPTTALFCLKVERYLFVERFQKVVEIDVSAWTS